MRADAVLREIEAAFPRPPRRHSKRRFAVNGALALLLLAVPVVAPDADTRPLPGLTSRAVVHRMPAPRWTAGGPVTPVPTVAPTSAPVPTAIVRLVPVPVYAPPRRTPAPTPTPTRVATPTPAPLPPPTPTATPTPTPTATPTPTPISTRTPTPTPSPRR